MPQNSCINGSVVAITDHMIKTTQGGGHLTYYLNCRNMNFVVNKDQVILPVINNINVFVIVIDCFLYVILYSCVKYLMKILNRSERYGRVKNHEII